MTKKEEEKKVYTRDQVYKASLDYFKGDELAADVFTNKYALCNLSEYYELTPDDMHKRLAKEFSKKESNYPNAMSEEEIYNLFKDFKYVCCQGSPMSAIGNPYRLESTSNCVVFSPPLDSYGGILYTDQQIVQACKRRCGIGFDISKLRPKGVKTNNASKTTAGIGVFMERFSNSIREVAQNGRRGAGLLSISIHHPEIKTFIRIKNDSTKVTGANLSVRLSDEFLQAVQNNKDYQLRFPVDSENPEITEYINAKEIWDEICISATNTGCPGLMIWGNIEKYTPSEAYAEEGYKATSTNPCGEICMGSPYTDACRLMLINLISFVENPFTKKAYFDFEKFKEISYKAQKLMDDLVDIETDHVNRIIEKVKQDPQPDHIKAIELDLWEGIKTTCQEARRTGLGITALADTLAALGIRYGSDESIKMSEQIYKTLCVSAYKSTCEMARDRGPFPIFSYKKETENAFIKRIWEADPEIKEMCKKYGRRNIALTTTAPAGSVSILTQTSSGIEPVFQLNYRRRRKLSETTDKNVEIKFVDVVGDKWTEYDVYHHQFKKWMSVSSKDKIEDSPYFKSSANEIDWINRVKLQAACQRWVCHSLSATVNLPKGTTYETVQQIYIEAWKSGVKGITVYVDESKSGVLLNKKDAVKQYQISFDDGTSMYIDSNQKIKYKDQEIETVEDLIKLK